MKIGHHKKNIKKKEETTSSIQGKKTFFGSLLYELRRRKIIEILAAFIGGGWLIIEFVHWILVDHYHFPEKSIDITFISLFGALISTIIWRLFREIKKKERKIKIEYLFISLVILATLLLDISFLMKSEKHVEEKTHKMTWENSIAVLPFVDLSPARDQDYLSDGMTDAIISKLSRLGELKVVSRTSVMLYKMKEKDIKVIGEELNVRNILEGSVQKVEDRVRVRAQLINAKDKQAFNQKRRCLYLIFKGAIPLE
jgi:TolB-like protein